MGNSSPEIANSWQQQKEASLLALRAGDFARAEQILQLTLQELERLAVETPEFVMTLELLADSLVMQKNYAQAFPHQERALRIRIDKQGPEQKEVGECMNKLARIQFELRQFAAAENLLKRSVEIHTLLFGADHQSTMAVAKNLTLINAAQSKYLQSKTRRKGWSINGPNGP